MGDPFGKKMPLITVTRDKKRWVFYYPEATRKSGEIEGFHPGAYTMRWFDPRKGAYGETCEFEIAGSTWRIPAKPDLNDWCLVVKEKQKIG